ncbi:MAG: 3-deoxy-D-manno-octulosonic acid transferase [Nitrospina sp.]|jgi:3-deoxy-D-manno-octulosonic-acid transferase|nr:3-deoxy-D-manno-octulosonic acid transferase [Nitrospina sp.]
MDILYYILTGGILLISSPFLLIRGLASSTFREDIKERLNGAKTLPKLKESLWIHASSVGEVRLAKTLITLLQEQGETRPITLSTFTPTGYALAVEEKLPHVFRLPIDFPLWMNPVFDRIEPSQLILIEAELWPCLLRQCKKRKIPVVQVNGRVSEKSIQRYGKFKSFFLWMTQAVVLFSMRSQTDADRLIELGIPEERIQVTGNIKFDVLPTGSDELKSVIFNSNSFLIVFGSTRPGDEGPVMEAFVKLKKDFQNIIGVIAPRHMQRCREVEDLIREFSVEYTLLSNMPEGDWANHPGALILVDKLGVLNSFYANAKLAYVGGGFNPRFGGQNILEPAAFDVPVLFGKHMNNFEEEAKLLIESGGGIQLQKEEELYQTLKKLLLNSEERQKTGRAAAETVRSHRGAALRTIKIIEETR